MASIFSKVVDNAVGRYVTKHTARLTSPDTSLFQIFNSYFKYGISGHSMTKFIDAYSSNPYVFNIINKIATTSSLMERVVTTKGDKEIVNSQILELYTPEVRQQANESILATGNTFLYYVDGVGFGGEVEVWHASNVEIFCNTIGDIIRYEYKTPWNKLFRVEGDELKKVLHLKTSNIVSCDGTSTKWGLSPLQAAWVVVQSSNEKFKAEASIFENRGAIGLVSNGSDIPMTGQERDKQQEALNGQIGGADKFNGVRVSTANLKFVQLGMSPTDLKLLEGLVSSLRILCSVYGISSVLFNDNDNSTYNNVSEAKASAYNEVYIPLARKMDSKVSIWLSEMLGIDETVKVNLNAIDEIKLSTNEIAQALNNLDTVAQEYVLAQMSQEQILALASAMPNGVAVGFKTQSNKEDGAKA